MYAKINKIVQKPDLLMQCSTLQAAVMPTSLITVLSTLERLFSLCAEVTCATNQLAACGRGRPDP